MDLAPLDAALAKVNMPYKFNYVRQHVINLLSQSPNLRPMTGTLMGNDGTSLFLFHLEGTIKIFHKGNSYNIPMRVWLPLEYPVQGPICFVTPTATMQIPPRHTNVGSDGKVYMKYLSQWDSRNSNLAMVWKGRSKTNEMIEAKPVFGSHSVYEPLCM